MAYVSVSFLLKTIPLYVYNTFRPSPSEDTGLASTISATMNDVASNVGVQTPLWDPAFNSLGRILRSESPGHMVLLYLSFWGSSVLFSIAAALFTFPLRVYKGSSFFQFSLETLLLKDVGAANFAHFSVISSADPLFTSPPTLTFPQGSSLLLLPQTSPEPAIPRPPQNTEQHSPTKFFP